MKRRVLLLLVGTFLWTAQAFAQQKTVTGKVTSDQGAPMAGVQIVVKGTGTGTLTNAQGVYSIRTAVGQVLQFSFIGTTSVERPVGAANTIDVVMRTAAINLDAVEATAFGQTAAKRSLGSAQQTVQGTAIAQSQKENWVNALQGRVAGVDIVSNSGVPGASSQILIRGVSSISGNNQPLIVVDGLPVDNKVPNSNTLFASQYENRTIDFTNRAADFNPNDIESVTVLKGPEAAALYGIDAANGAIVITTKRGKPGMGGFEYSNSIKVEHPGRKPEIQTTYGPSTVASGGSLVTNVGAWYHFGTPYPANVTRYDNIGAFFQDAVTQKHNLAFSGASPDSRITYRLSGSTQQQRGVIPNAKWNKVNVSASTQAMLNEWLKTDVVIQYSTDSNNQPFKGDGGPLLGLLAWPDTIDASVWLTTDGKRKRMTCNISGSCGLSQSAEIDNPFFSVNRNYSSEKTNRINLNAGFTFSPVTWANLKTNVGVDNYNSKISVKKDPESAFAGTTGGILDENNDIVRNIAIQNLLNFNRQAITKDIGVTAMIGNSVEDKRDDSEGITGTGFIEPTFVSINNTTSKSALANLYRQRRMSVFGQTHFDYRDYLHLTVTGRNDWTSTIPTTRNSFFYPSVQGSFIFTDAFPATKKIFSAGKLRAAWAEVGKDAKPYAYAPSLEAKLTSYGGYGYGFTGPNPQLKPEFAVSKEAGFELGFLNGRLGLDGTIFRKETRDQIVNNVRASYGSGYILINLNGATTVTKGQELTVTATPIQRRNFSWDFQANFSRAHGKVTKMPEGLPEYYSSDTWIINNIRNGVNVGSSTMGVFGLWYARNQNGDVLIEPTTGLPIRQSNFTAGPYDRQPDFTVGLNNTVTLKRFSLSALLDIRKGGDVLNGTEWWLTRLGLSPRTLDRWEPRIVKGVLRDGLENTANPTKNTIVVIPALNTGYYTGISEELFMEKNINWLRLREVTLSYNLPRGMLKTRTASVYVTGTELFLLTNYTGMDPVVNGNTAATGGSGAIGIDWGNFPVPTGINVGVKVGF